MKPAAGIRDPDRLRAGRSRLIPQLLTESVLLAASSPSPSADWELHLLTVMPRAGHIVARTEGIHLEAEVVAARG